MNETGRAWVKKVIASDVDQNAKLTAIALAEVMDEKGEVAISDHDLARRMGLVKILFPTGITPETFEEMYG